MENEPSPKFQNHEAIAEALGMDRSVKWVGDPKQAESAKNIARGAGEMMTCLMIVS